MGEDDIVELLWKNGQVVRQSQTQRPPAPSVLRGSGSGGGEEGNVPFTPPPLPLLQHQQQPSSHQSLFIQEDEMASWLYHHNLTSDLLYSGVTWTSATYPQSSISLAPPIPPPLPPPSVLYDPRSAENFMHFSRLRENIFPGGSVEGVVIDSTHVGSSAIPTSSGTGSSLTPATEGIENRATIFGRTSHTLVVPSLGRHEHTVALDTQVKTEPFPTQQAAETDITGERKRQEREETSDETEEPEEARGSTSRKRSRAAEMHNLSERRRRETINEKMKTLQELIPCCNKADKVSLLEDTIQYVKALQMQLQMMSMGCGMMPKMYTPNMERFMPHMAMGVMGMNRPPFLPFPGSAFPRTAHMAGLSQSYPPPRYPFQNVQAFDPSRVYQPSQQPDPVLNQPQFQGELYPYSQFVGPQQMQQLPPPPSSHNQTTSELSLGQASGSKEPEDHEKKPTG